METHPGPEHLEHLFKHRVVQDGDPRDNKNLPTGRGVGHINRFQRRILPHTNSQSVQEVHAFSHPGSVLPVQGPTLWSVHSSHGVHSGGQRGQTHGTSEGYKDRPVPRRLAGESLYPRHLSPAYSNPGHTLSGTRLAGEQGKIRTGPQTGLQLCRLPVRPERGQGQTNRRTLAGLDRQDQIHTVGSGLPGLTEKQVHFGRLHMRPIQWHLKNNWRVPESLEKVIPVPKSLHPHLRWWLEESNVLRGQPLHPLKHALQIFTDASKEGWGAHLDEHTARGTWSLPESKLHINHLELKAVFLALKEFRTLVSNKTVLIATDNTTVVAYINKEGGMKSGSLCALLWRILSWCTRQQVTLRARHIPGRLNVIADKLSRLGQTIQTEWSLHPEVFQAVCSTWHQPQVDLFATRFNNTQSLLGGPGPIRLPTSSHLGQSGGEAPGLPLQQNNSDCSRVAQHALVWGPGSNVKPDPTVSAQHTQSSVSAIQPGPSQEPVESEPTCLAPRASAIKEQGFSEAVAARLLDSFHRDRPRGRRGIPSWNLSLVLHQLTKAPFEPLKEASLKHLTFKTVFLLALGSGKRRSEIHAWLHKNIRHQSDWSKVSLYPSPSFLSKNQLAKEGPDSVAPVVIPALAPSLDRSLKGDRSLCPVRALHYYLDRTADLRQNKELVFVSFKKGFDKDISPATISSWIKQTVILCYERSDQEALTLHQVKAHDVRAFAASKAFQSGISLDQILSACHWKSHNTFTQFYLKDVAWADSELFHLGPVVAAQQVHHQAQR